MKSLPQQVNQLPTSPGVYLFYNNRGRVIYVGKATNLRSRVRTYFKKGATPTRPIEHMMHKVTKVDYEQTDSALEALIVEANLIKLLQPQYNVDGKDDKSWQYVCISKDKFPQVVLVRGHELTAIRKRNFRYVFGPYTSGTNLKEAIKILRKLFSFSTCKPTNERPCLYYEMGQCLGVCTGDIAAQDYKKKVITPLRMFLEGKKKTLLKRIQKEMEEAAKTHDFEEAARLRDQLRALQHIQDIALINKEFVEDDIRDGKKLRIEGYDIAHISGTSMVGSMVVFNERESDKPQYRKFKIKTVEGSNDTAALKEVLSRRLKHPEWPYPDVFLIDGGKGQVNAARSVLQEKVLNIPVVGIAKGPERKKNEFFCNPASPALEQWVEKHKRLLIQTRDEAHRFAQGYHKKMRSKASLA